MIKEILVSFRMVIAILAAAVALAALLLSLRNHLSVIPTSTSSADAGAEEICAINADDCGNEDDE